MHRSKFSGYTAFPVVSFLLLTAAASGQYLSPNTQPANNTLLASTEIAPAYSSSAQTTSQQAAPAQADAPQAQDPALNPPPAPTEQQRAQLARQAQDRVRARRAQRIAAIVQDTYSHKYEVYGGYSFMRLTPGPNLQKVDENGFFAGFTDYLNNKLGITAEGRGYFGNAYVGNLNSGITFFEPSISNYSVSAGPQYRFYMHQKWGVSGVAEVGVARNVFYANSQSLPGTYVGLFPDAWRLTATVSVPIDYNLGPGLSLRMTPTYYLTNFGSQVQNNRGVTAGINYRFGRR